MALECRLAGADGGVEVGDEQQREVEGEDVQAAQSVFTADELVVGDGLYLWLDLGWRSRGVLACWWR